MKLILKSIMVCNPSMYSMPEKKNMEYMTRLVFKKKTSAD